MQVCRVILKDKDKKIDAIKSIKDYAELSLLNAKNYVSYGLVLHGRHFIFENEYVKTEIVEMEKDAFNSILLVYLRNSMEDFQYLVNAKVTEINNVLKELEP